jgi:hypothetical protein
MTGRLTLSLLLVLIGVLAVPGSAPAKRCWPAAAACPAETYERKAAQAASRHARQEFDKDVPPSMWTVVCYPGESRVKIECSVVSRDPDPADCVGGMTMRKRDGRWRAKNIEMSCRR